MATFESTRSMRVQRHFEVLEIDLPVITGACTLGASSGFGTPLTCDQAWASEYKTYYFTNQNAPIIPNINGEPIYRCIESISENSTELKPGSGLSSRGTLTITFTDFTKQDPNIGAPGVSALVKSQGTYFGKLSARQVFENKTARLKLYRVEADGSVDLTNGAETHTFLTNTLSLNTNGSWKSTYKDILALVNLNEKTWPITKGGFLRQDITDINATIMEVDEFVDYSTAFAVRVGKEHFRVISVSGNLTSSAQLTVATRGAPINAPVSGVRLTNTVKDEHSAGDEVFISELSDNETIDSLIARILTDSDLDASFIPAAEWAAEVLEWHALDKINTLHSESESVNDAINRILNGYLMDLFYSTIEAKIKLIAISVWKESTAVLTEGKEIEAYSIKKVPRESMRASRALVIYDKTNLADNDDTASYKKASQFSDNTIIGPELFTKHKDKLFENNHLIDKDAADLLTQRYVSRFKFTPFERNFECSERNLTFKAGDVVDLISSVDQGADGLTSSNIRAQIIKINPKYNNKFGREYNIKALTYEAAFNAGSEIVLSSPLGSVNLHILAGAPSAVVELTFVLDGSFSFGATAIRAGAFAAGSKIILITANGFDGQANGGSGGAGESIEYDFESNSLITFGGGNGTNGGIVYDAQGIDTDVYFSGATPSTAYPTADGSFRAPSGGDGGFAHTGSNPNFVSGDGGDGGDGRSAGTGGNTGTANGTRTSPGTAGTNGEIDGSGSGFGNDGVDNNEQKGLKGSGIIDSGATVNLFGATALRYINGNGSHP